MTSPYLDKSLRSEAQARMERFRERIEPAGPCDQADNEPRAVQRRWDLSEVMNELSMRLSNLASELDDLIFSARGQSEPNKAAVKRIGLAVEELGRDLRAFAEAI